MPSLEPWWNRVARTGDSRQTAVCVPSTLFRPSVGVGGILRICDARSLFAVPKIRIIMTAGSRKVYTKVFVVESA